MRTQISPGGVIDAIRAGHNRFGRLCEALNAGPDLIRHTLQFLRRQGVIVAASNRVWYVTPIRKSEVFVSSEVERLRAALRQIAQLADGDWTWKEEIKRTALRALGEVDE